MIDRSRGFTMCSYVFIDRLPCGIITYVVCFASLPAILALLLNNFKWISSFAWMDGHRLWWSIAIAQVQLLHR